MPPSRGSAMEVRAPEAGLYIDRDMVVVMTLHGVLVSKHRARPLALKFLVDSQQDTGVDGHFEGEYELPGGEMLKVFCKKMRDDMVFTVRRGRSQLSYSVKLSQYVNDDLLPVNMEEYEDLVKHWLED